MAKPKNRRQHRRRMARTKMLVGGCWLILAVTLFSACARTQSAHTFSREYGARRIPVDPPPVIEGKPHYDDFVNGGQLFNQYCGSCHNARTLGERPFNQTEVAFAHMRRHAYLTGKEYRALIHFLRRWHDVGPATPEFEPTPKRMFFSQPISELKPKEDVEK